MGSLIGLAIGDALGMPTQMMSRAEVARRFGPIRGFEPGPADQPIAPGVPAGRVTDDTDQALILARRLVADGGRLDLARYAEELLAWHDEMSAIGSLDLLGPSTMRALQAYRAGVPLGETGRWGDTNGAAMRVAPVGIACLATPLAYLAHAVAAVDVVTHDTRIANAGACAIAAAVSAGVAGAAVDDAVELALDAARVGAEHGHDTPGGQVAERIEWALSLVAEPGVDVLEVIDRQIGTSVATQESVPAALALVSAFGDDPWRAVCMAASLGGDCDTIGAMVGAVLGACHGIQGWPRARVLHLEAANPGVSRVALAPLVDGLLALRHPARGAR